MEQTSQWGLRFFKDLQNYTKLYAVIWKAHLSYYAEGFERYHSVLTLCVTTVRTF
jgi:hypothetical protein